GLLVRTEYRLLTSDDGLDGKQLLVVRLQPRRQQTSETPLALRHRLEQQVATIPGVRQVAFASTLPISSANAERVKRSEASNEGLRAAAVNYVTAGYFQTVPIPFLLGGPFAESGFTQKVAPIVVTEQFARSFWQGENPV